MKAFPRQKAMGAMAIALVACVASAKADVDPVAYVKDALARGCSRIVVPKGVYEIEPGGPNETVYFRLKGIKDATIDFSGSKLVGKVATRLFDIADCTNLVLRNFTVDYAFLPYTQAVIEKVDAEKSWVVRVIDGYPLPDISYELGGGLKDHNPDAVSGQCRHRADGRADLSHFGRQEPHGQNGRYRRLERQAAESSNPRGMLLLEGVCELPV